MVFLIRIKIPPDAIPLKFLVLPQCIFVQPGMRLCGGSFVRWDSVIITMSHCSIVFWKPGCVHLEKQLQTKQQMGHMEQHRQNTNPITKQQPHHSHVRRLQCLH